MKSSKIIQYLRTLSKEEWQRFDRFVHSPYFNTHEETTRLWETLYSIYPDLSDELVAKEQIFARMFPNMSFDERKLYNLSKYLLKLLTEFLIVEHRKNDRFEREYLAQIYQLAERQLDQYIPRLIRQGEKVLNELKGEDSNAALLAYKFAFLQTNYALSRDNRSIESDIHKVSEKLDRFFVLEKIRSAVPIANSNYILAKRTQLSSVQEAIRIYQQYQWTDFPLLHAYYLALIMLQAPEGGEDNFNALVQYLNSIADQISKVECRALYNYALNFCSIQSKRGKTHYLEFMFSIFESMMEQDLLLSDPYVAPPNFKNAVTLAIKLKKFDWTENFIQQNSHKLPESHRDIIMHYSMANLAFVQKKFSIAQKHLLEVDFLDPFYRLSADILLLKIYYEIKEIESLFFKILALRKYLQRDKTLAEQNRKAYKNFCRVLYKMSRWQFDRSGKLVSLEKMIANTRPLVEKQWLNDKIELLKDNY